MFSRLYIHTPWCLSKCGYCGFYSAKGVAGEADMTAGLVLQEMELCADIFKGGPLDSIYFGGGTPSLLSPGCLKDIINLSSHLWKHCLEPEITLEANPCTVTQSSLAGFADAGINRISLGIQSFDDKKLSILGRRHDSKTARQAFMLARQTYGINSISIDLICGLPSQTPDEWEQDICDAMELAPDHISVYALSIEPGSPFDAIYSMPKNMIKLPDEDQAADMLEKASLFLEKEGYDHYEISSFAKPGHQSRHNNGYWKREGYMGFGPGAHSFINRGWGLRFANPSDTGLWSEKIQAGTLAHKDINELKRHEAFSEHIFLGLRRSEGIASVEIPAVFGDDIWQYYLPTFSFLKDNGLLHDKDGRYFLSDRGRMISNQIFARFI